MERHSFDSHFDPERTEAETEKEAALQSRLSRILGQKITVENIDSYFDGVLNGLIDFTEEVVRDYEAHNPSSGLEGRELEDAAFSSFNLMPLGSFIDVANDKIGYLNKAEQVTRQHVDRVITPPGEKQGLKIGGNEAYVKPNLKNRLLGLLYIIQQQGISLEDTWVREGAVSNGMMRKQPYFSVIIPQLERAVMVCDEEGNASYVFNLALLAEVQASIEEVEDMTKTDKNHFINSNPGIGLRFIYTPDWMAKTEDLLTGDLVDPAMSRSAREDSEIAHVNVVELDPWRGFWTDPATGEHWGSSVSIATELQWTLPHIAVVKMATRQRPLYTVNGRLGTGYCLEDFVVLLKEKAAAPEGLDLPTTETNGVWQDFYEESSENHWGTVAAIAKKLQVSERFLQYTLRNKPTKWILNRSNRKPYVAYRVEDFEAEKLPPPLDKSGDWKAFHVDNAGSHWGNISRLAAKLNVNDVTIKKYIPEDLPTIDVWAPGSQGWRQAYRYEDIVKVPAIAKIVEGMKMLPRSAEEGPTKGFFSDSIDGTSWGTIVALARVLPFKQTAVTTFIRKHPELLTRPGMVGNVNQERTFYNYEQISEILRQENPELIIPEHVGVQDEWKDFEVDAEGNYWGTAKDIAEKLGKGYAQIKRRLEGKPSKMVPLPRGQKGRPKELFQFKDALDPESEES